MEPTILIVEDSPSVRRLVEICLRSLPIRILQAEDGLEALEVAFAELPDAIVLDIGLPHLDGWEVLSRIRTTPATTTTPVLVLTAHAQPEVEAQAEAGGANGFMTKPFGPEDLRIAVKDLLRGKI
jgi:two-component system chemotaxis response regulator CheY